MANEITEQEEVKCSFCGKPQSQVKKIVAGNGVYICNECIYLSKKIIDDELLRYKIATPASLLLIASIKYFACLL